MKSEMYHASTSYYKARNRQLYWKYAKLNLVFLSVLFIIITIISKIKSNPTIDSNAFFSKPSFLLDAVNKYLGGPIKIEDPLLINKLRDEKSLKNCKLCLNPKRHDLKKSTNADLALTFGFGDQIHYFLTWMRSLRNTGCNCGVLIFVSPGYLKFFTNETLKELQNCGANFLTLNSFEGADERTLRNLVILSFLDQYGSFFNRIFINDIFDTLFQGDPFDEHLPKDKVTVSIERVTFKHHGWAIEKQNYTDDNFTGDFYSNKLLLNGGIFMGPSFKVYELYLTMFNPKIFFRENVNDQSILNYVYYRGLYTDINVDFDAHYYSSACYSIFEQHPRKDGKMYELNGKYAPVVIHQFDRICPLMIYDRDVCPALKTLNLTYLHKKWFGNPERPRFTHISQKCGEKDSDTRMFGYFFGPNQDF